METSKPKGLSLSEISRLQEKYGKNEIEEEIQSTIVRFLKKFIAPIPLMIEIALVLSLIAGRWEDFSIILVLLSVNIFIEFFQEQKANKALQALKKTLTPTAIVLRDNKFSKIDARDLVPSDIVQLSIGDVVPADAVILGDGYLHIDQSIITGESFSVERKKNETIYAGSVIQRGKSLVRVVTIGADTMMGQNVDLVKKAQREEKSHFQKAVLTIGKFLIILSVSLTLFLFGFLIARGDPLIESVRFALVLTIASIPVALPAVLTVTMSIGASVLAKKNTIVSNFKAIEELAGIDELCVDKTGTLTQNKVTVFSSDVYGKFNEKDLFTYALLAITEGEKSPIESAIYRYASEHDFHKKVKQYDIDTIIPFDPTRKMTEVSAHLKNNGSPIDIVMGAPQIIQGLVVDNDNSKQLFCDVQEMAKKGLRSLAVAKKVEGVLIPVGMISLLDPPRKDSASMVAAIKKRNVRIKMLTGDHMAIGKYIARTLGIGSNHIKASVLHNLQKTKTIHDDASAITNADVFTEVVPSDKYHIVDILQKENHIVAMTGDGVNDAPALKKADVGIAVSGASPAARSASDIILLSDGLSVIKDAIDHARMTFLRMHSYATFRISETIRVVIFITLAILVFNYSPLSAVMIVLLSLLNDIPVMAIAYDNVPTQKRPVRWNMHSTLFIASILGVAGVISSFMLFYWLHISGYPVAIIQTIIFIKLDVAGHSTLYLTRTGRDHFWKRPFPSLKFFLPAFSSRIIGTLIAVFGIFMEPISWEMVGYIWIYATIWFFINDQIKVFGYKLFDKIQAIHDSVYSK